jgi:cytochrome b involved in lipid metabolism
MKKILLAICITAVMASGNTNYNSTAKASVLQKTFTMKKVKAANTSKKCWFVVSGKVYDLTKWISKHPGGKGAIKSLCGLDGTAAFNGQHEGQKKPSKVLKTYYIGNLK